MDKTTFGVVIVAGGSSSRFGTDKLLETVTINDVESAVIVHTLKQFLKLFEDENIVVVTTEKNISLYQKVFTDIAIELSNIKVVVGGNTRSHSALNGLKALSDSIEFAVVHDAARPFISTDVIKSALVKASERGSTVVGRIVVDTLKKIDMTDKVVADINRDEVVAVETPQIFRRSELIAAYEEVLAENIVVTDEAGAMSHSGHDCYILKHSTDNRKITFPSDI